MSLLPLLFHSYVTKQKLGTPEGTFQLRFKVIFTPDCHDLPLFKLKMSNATNIRLRCVSVSEWVIFLSCLRSMFPTQYSALRSVDTFELSNHWMPAIHVSKRSPHLPLLSSVGLMVWGRSCFHHVVHLRMIWGLESFLCDGGSAIHSSIQKDKQMLTTVMWWDLLLYKSCVG